MMLLSPQNTIWLSGKNGKCSLIHSYFAVNEVGYSMAAV